MLLVDGKIEAAAQEERFTRKKYDASFPHHAIKYVLEEAGLQINDLNAVTFYDKPFLKFERLLETYHAFAPRGIKSFVAALPVWIREKLLMKRLLREELAKIGLGKPLLLFPEHHLSHAASAFYPSPFKEAAIITIDGVGEWASSTICHGNGNKIKILRQLDFPHSIGLLYSAFTYYCGFRVNSGEYKLMGLAPYGNPQAERTQRFKRLILDELVDLRDDGSLLLNMDYFNFATGLTMCREKKWQELFGIPLRQPETDIEQHYMDLAHAIQQILEEIVIRLARTAKEQTGSDYCVMAGGVALNCVANGKLLREGIFEDIWIQPAAGDAGGALGAALSAWHIFMNEPRRQFLNEDYDHMNGAYWGPEFGVTDIKRIARRYHAPYQEYNDFGRLCHDTAHLLKQGYIVGWFQGRMEWGPRALGNRSIIGDPRDPEIQKRLNLKIKFREGFRPLAPSVLEEDISDYFELDRLSPYMLLVAPVKESLRKPLPKNYHDMEMYDRLYFIRSDIPAITHVDYSARIQSVSRKTNERYWRLISAFKRATGCGVIVNTSFNVRGEPIVCTPKEAYQCFMRTDMDFLVIGDFLFRKDAQPYWQEEGRHGKHALD